jgi:hypothetical protein
MMDFDLDLSSPSLSQSHGTNSGHEETLAHLAGVQHTASPWEQLAEAMAYTAELTHISSASNTCLPSLLSSSNTSIFAGIREIDLHDDIPVTLKQEPRYSR